MERVTSVFDGFLGFEDWKTLLSIRIHEEKSESESKGMIQRALFRRPAKVSDRKRG